MSERILTVEKLNVYYRNEGKLFRRKKDEKHAVKDADLYVDKGEIVGLIGESGCGKSTLAKAVMGMIPYQSGTVSLEDKHPQMVFRDPFGSLNPAKKIGFILREPLRNLTEMTAEEQSEAVKKMLARVGLEEKYEEHYPKELSGGQRQRVAIANALMIKPKLVIADEPVSALDVTIQEQVLRLLLSLKEEMDLSMIFITHDLRVAYQVCNRILVMKDGVIVEQGEVEELYRNPQHEYTKKLLAAADIEL